MSTTMESQMRKFQVGTKFGMLQEYLVQEIWYDLQLVASVNASHLAEISRLSLTYRLDERLMQRLTDYVYELLPESNPDVELVFFHGLQMKGSDPACSFWRTWKMRKSEECWPEMLLPRLLTYRNGADEEYKCKLRVLSVSYAGKPNLGEDGLGTARGDEFLISECLFHDLILGGRGNVGQRAGVPVFLVGHDLGGILIKEFVMMVERKAAEMRSKHDREKAGMFLENLKSVHFYATPHSGSVAIEELAERIGKNDANPMLRLMKVLSNETARINEDFQRYRQKYRNGQSGSKSSRVTSHAFHALNITNEGGFKHVLVVPEGSARSQVDSFYSVAANHFSVCQPEDSFSSPVLRLKDEIIKEVREAKGELEERIYY